MNRDDFIPKRIEEGNFVKRKVSPDGKNLLLFITSPYLERSFILLSRARPA